MKANLLSRYTGSAVIRSIAWADPSKSGMTSPKLRWKRVSGLATLLSLAQIRSRTSLEFDIGRPVAFHCFIKMKQLFQYCKGPARILFGRSARSGGGRHGVAPGAENSRAVSAAYRRRAEACPAHHGWPGRHADAIG